MRKKSRDHLLLKSVFVNGVVWLVAVWSPQTGMLAGPPLLLLSAMLLARYAWLRDQDEAGT